MRRKNTQNIGWEDWKLLYLWRTDFVSTCWILVPMVTFVHFLCLRPKKIDEKKCALPLHDFFLKLAVSH